MSTPRILLVVDEPVVAEHLKALLPRLGFLVVGEATGGPQALALAKQLRPDVVLLEARLDGETDGPPVRERIGRELRLPVVLLTASLADDGAVRARIAGPLRTVPRPIDDRELQATLERALAQHRADEEIRRLQRLCTTLSQINQTIIRVPSREELFASIVRIALEFGEFTAARIDRLDPATGQLHRLAQAGGQTGLDASTDHAAAVASALAGGTGLCNEASGAAEDPASLRSFAVVPLRFQGAVCGVLSLVANEPGFFQQPEIRMIEEIARDASFALDQFEAAARRHKAEAEVQRRNRQLQVLSRAAQQINRILDVPMIQRELVAAALELTGAESGGAGLFQAGAMVFTEYNQKGRLVPIDYRFTAAVGVPGHIVQTRQPYLSADAAHDPHVIPAIQQALGFQTLADVPILNAGGELLGCFEIHNKSDGNPFDAQDVELLQGLAASAAIALENSRLLAQREQATAALQQQATELAALNALGRVVSATLSLDETVAAALAGMWKAVQPSMVFLFLREGDRLILKDLLPANAHARLGEMPEHRVGECMCGLAVGERKALYSCDVATDHRCTWAECKRAGVKAFAALPLFRGQTIIGVLGLTADTGRDFERQSGFLETLAHQVAIAIANAQLYEAAQREVAERKRAEDTLREEKLVADTLIDHIPGLFYVLDPEGRLVRWNRRLEVVTGRTAAEVAQQPILEFLPPEESEAVAGSIRETFRQGEASVEAHVLARDGTRTPYLLSGRRLALRGQVYLLGVGFDLSESRRTEAALLKEQALFNGLLATMPDKIYFKDRQSRFVRINASMARLFGVAQPADLLGKTDSDFFSEEHARAAFADEQRIMASGEALIDLEEKETWPDGHITWVSTTKVPLRDALNRVVGLVGISRDITAHKQAEQALRRIEWMLTKGTPAAHPRRITRAPTASAAPADSRRILDAVGEEVLTDIVGDFLDLLGTSASVYERDGSCALNILSSEWCALMNRSAPARCSAASAGPPGVDGQPICHQSCGSEAARRSFATGEPTDLECASGIRLYSQPIRAGGEIIGAIDMGYGDPPREPEKLRELAARCGVPFEELAAGARAYESRPPYIVALAKRRLAVSARLIGEIVERKQAEQAQREARQLLRDVLDTVPVRVFWKDLEGRFLGCNLALAQDAGFSSPDQLIGKTDFELTWRELAEFYRANDRKVAETGIAILGFEEPQPRGDRTQWLRTSKIPLREPGGATIGVLCTYEDITESKLAQKERERLQEQLTHSQKMESVGRLAGGVAHDFNNMLQAILGNASFALAELPPDSPLRESLVEIEVSAQRSADLTRQLLTFARKQTIQPRVLDLNETVASMLKMLRRLIGESIHLVWMPGSSLWPVKADPSQIDQILANLCVNARDAIAGTGTVTIRTARVTLDATCTQRFPDGLPGDYVTLSVGDTGCGMDAETQSHLFEPFFTTKGVGEGTGLGLATVFGIIKQNRGLIEVASAPGKGATFTIYLPRTTAATTIAAAADQHRSVAGTETILLVEDEEQVLNLSRRILGQHGYTVLACSAPEVALSLASRHSGRIDLLVTDVVMPNLNGRDLRTQVAAIHPSLKCLFISGYPAEVIAHQGIVNESLEFLQKPFPIRTLVERVRAILDQTGKPPGRG